MSQNRNQLSTHRNGGRIGYDLCFGGVFYALIDIEQLGYRIQPDNARELATIGVKIRDLIDTEIPIEHPETPEIHGIAYVMFYQNEADGAVRTCTTMKPARVDRSPCGTGSNAYLALKHQTTPLTAGTQVLTRSIIGSDDVVNQFCTPS